MCDALQIVSIIKVLRLLFGICHHVIDFTGTNDMSMNELTIEPLDFHANVIYEVPPDSEVELIEDIQFKADDVDSVS